MFSLRQKYLHYGGSEEKLEKASSFPLWKRNRRIYTIHTLLKLKFHSWIKKSEKKHLKRKSIENC